MAPELIPYPNAGQLCDAVAEQWLAAVGAAASRVEPHRVALSGGRIAKDLMAAIAARAMRTMPPLAHVEFFWGDERCVPPDHPESNYRVAAQTLLKPLGIAASRIHRIQGELAPALAAQAAESDLRTICPLAPNGQPILDLILLGMGEDGHVASLFPGAQPEVNDPRTVFFPVIGPKPPPQRVTLTYPAIEAAREVWVLVSGAAKENALRDSLSAGGITPLARVLATRKVTIFFSEVTFA